MDHFKSYSNTSVLDSVNPHLLSVEQFVGEGPELPECSYFEACTPVDS